MKGIRGAICATENSREAIHQATRRLLVEISARNGLTESDVIAVFFTMTPDLNADFPAYAARDMGWTEVAMLGAQESVVPRALERVIRVLLLVKRDGPVRHVYLGGAAAMRPDLAEPGDERLWHIEAPGRDPAAGREEGQVTSRDLNVGGAELGRLLVVGLGMIGGSVAAAARVSRLFDLVAGYDLNPEHSESARRLELVDHVADDLAEELARADLVVLATPIAAIVQILNELGAHARPGAVITDVGSTKRAIVAAMDGLPASARAVGGHPMTGKTESGPLAASAELFRGARWAVVPGERSDEESLRRVEELVRGVGATPVRMSAETHDAAVAITSHLPVLMAGALVETARRGRRETSPVSPLIGPGFLSAGRLAAGNPLLTAQMLSENADNLSVAIRDYTEALARLADACSTPEALYGRLIELREGWMALTEKANREAESMR